MAPGVLRIELENRETSSFRFEPESTAGDAVAALCDNLGFRDPNLFSLVFAPPAEIEDSHAGLIGHLKLSIVFKSVESILFS